MSTAVAAMERDAGNQGKVIHANTIGYAWLPADDVFPVYEMPAAFDPDNLTCNALAAAQLRTAVDAKARFLLLQDFGCNYPPGKPRYNPYHLADAYSRLLSGDEFEGKFSAVVVVTSARFAAAFARSLRTLATCFTSTVLAVSGNGNYNSGNYGNGTGGSGCVLMRVFFFVRSVKY